MASQPTPIRFNSATTCIEDVNEYAYVNITAVSGDYELRLSTLDRNFGDEFHAAWA